MQKTGILIKLLIIVVFVFKGTIAWGNNSDSTLSNLFEMSVEDLIEQKVTIATKSTQKVTQSPSTISVITADEIKAMGYREMEEVLGSIPGIGFTQTRLGTKPFEIRGISDIRQGGRLLVMIDGIPANGVMYGSAFFYGANYNLDQVERVEVIRGPGSALYGRNAFSGVVNIITKKATKHNQIKIGTEWGSFNTFGFNAISGIKTEKFNSYLAAKYYTTDGTSSKFDNGMGGTSKFNMTHDNYYINGNTEYKSFQLFYSFLNATDGNSAGPFITNGNTIFKIGTYSLRFNKMLTSKMRLSANIFGRNENRVQNVEQYKPNTTSIHPDYGVPINMLAPEGIYAQPVYDDYTYGGEIEVNYQLLKSNDLLIGFQADMHGIKNAKVKSNYDLSTNFPLNYRDEDSVLHYYSKNNMPSYGPGWIKDEGHDYNNAALYLQDVQYILPNLSLTIGGRLDFDSEAGLIFNPRLGMVYEQDNWAWIKILYGEAYRAPTTNEQYKIMGFDKGNEKLNYEEIKTSEISFGTKFKRLYSQVSLYYNQLDNVILQQSIDSLTKVKSYFNTGKNVSYGAELESKFFISNSVYTFLNYSYCQSEDTRVLFGIQSTITHPNVSFHKLNSGLNIQFNKYLVYSALINYISPITKFRKNADEYVSKDRVGDYLLLNSSLRILNVIKGFELSLYVYNLLNKTYYFQDDQNEHQPSQPKIHFLFKASYSVN